MDGGLTAGEAAQECRHPAIDHIQPVLRVFLNPAHHLRIDFPLRKHPHGAGSQSRLPFGDTDAGAQIGVQEMPGRAQHARHFGEDEELWRVTALLHDFDYEMHPTLDKHPQDGAPILREEGYPEIVIEGVLSHAEHLAIAVRDEALGQ